MNEKIVFRLINLGTFIGLVAGVLIVSTMDLSAVRLAIAYSAIFIGWIMAVAMNQETS